MPLRGRLEKKGPSDALPLFLVCARRGLADSRGAAKQSVWHKVTSTVICMFQAVIPSLWLTGPAGADWKCAQPHSACLLSSACPKQKACATAAHRSESNWSSYQHPAAFSVCLCAAQPSVCTQARMWVHVHTHACMPT